MAPILLKLMDTPSSIITKATTYLKIYFLGVPMLMVYNFGSQMLRALGDSKRPMYILIISGLFNVCCDLLFVCAFKMDVKGVAIATVISQFVSAFLTIGWFIINKNGFVRLKLQELKVSKKSF